jgi:release factor glutamine methyltransferase
MADTRGAESSDGAAQASAARTVSAASLWAQRVLLEADVDSPRLDAELLLTHVLGWHRARLYTRREQEVQCDQWTRYKGLVVRRARREPLAYLLGDREFYGLHFFVDPRVLVPRPETEVLLERVLRQGTERLRSASHLTIADVGTGCGVIAIVLALNLSGAEVYAIDSSAPALEVAARNCCRYGVEEMVHLLEGDLLRALPEPVDVVVANLPYVAVNEVAALPPEIRCYEPRRAWDGGAQGLQAIERLLVQAGEYLNDGGSILLEIGSTQGSAVQSIAAERFPGALVDVAPDLAGLDRVVSIAHVCMNKKKEGKTGPCLT